MAIIGLIGFSQQSYLDYSTHLRSPLFIYPSNLVKISWSGAQICPRNEIRNGCSGGGILLLISILTSVIIWGLSVYDPTKFQESRSTHCWDVQFNVFLRLPLTLDCQRHNDTVPSGKPSICTSALKWVKYTPCPRKKETGNALYITATGLAIFWKIAKYYLY